jgi:hypothetical protein
MAYGNGMILRLNKILRILGTGLFCILGVLLLIGTMFAQTGYGLPHQKNSCEYFFYSSAPALPNVSSRPAQFSFTESIKQKKTIPVRLNLFSAIRYFSSPSHFQFVRNIRIFSGISHASHLQAYLLLDLPPPSLL